MYSLRVLFFTLPLYFSHIFSPLGVILGESYSFERQKVYLFFILVIFAYIEGCIKFPHNIWLTYRQYAFIIILLFIIPIVSAFSLGSTIDIGWLIGGHEKHHGYIFYIGIIGFTILVMTSSKEQLRSYINWSIASALLVALIAIGEFLGGVLDIYGRSEMISIYPGRSSSTLGNPNYVAGYLLPFVPIMLEDVWRNQKTLIKNEGMNYLLRLTIILCLLLAVVVTGSYIALLLLAILVISYSVSYLLYGYSKVKQIITLATIVAIFILGSLILLDPVKLLSLQSRFILMKESMLVIFAHPVNILIGFGPDSLLTQFSIARSTLVDAYFPQNMLIDSSHNIFIDILFQYGIFPVYLILRFIIINYEKLTTPTGLSIVLLLTFLTFNVFVISHIIVLILLFVFTFKD